MSLFLNDDLIYMRPLRGSPYLFASYCQYLIYRPWLSIELRFGSQICYSGCIYFWQLRKEFYTEVGRLRVEKRLTLQGLQHYFLLKPWPCLKS